MTTNEYYKLHKDRIHGQQLIYRKKTYRPRIPWRDPAMKPVLRRRDTDVFKVWKSSDLILIAYDDDKITTGYYEYFKYDDDTSDEGFFDNYHDGPIEKVVGWSPLPEVKR